MPQQQEGTTQVNYDDSTYTAEKRILQDAEMHRARVFHHSGAFTSLDDEKVRQWLDAWPG